MGYDKNIFAHNLQLLMRECNQKQADIAKVLGVSKATMSDYCNGKQMPRMDKLQRLADYFHTRVSSLIEEPLRNSLRIRSWESCEQKKKTAPVRLHQGGKATNL